MAEPKKIYQITQYEREDGARIIVKTEVTNSPLPITGEFIGMGAVNIQTPMGAQQVPLTCPVEATDLKEAFAKPPEAVNKAGEQWKKDQQEAQFKAKLAGK